VKALRLRTAGWVFVAIILAAAVALVLVQREVLPRVRMADGSELRILKVEVGVLSIHPLETQFKRVLRRWCPDPWEPALLGSVPRPFRYHTRHDSLLVWADWRTPKGQPITDRKNWEDLRMKTVEGTKNYARPVIALPGSGLACLEFRHFRRDSKQLSVSIWNGNSEVPIQIENPRPVKPALWMPESIPLTNHFPETEIILLRTGRHQYSNPDWVAPRLSVKSLVPSPGSWVEWRITAMDALGNWTETGYPSRSPTSEFEWKSEGVWKLVAEGMEYFSAVFFRH
jgi:hypothetical protein